MNLEIALLSLIVAVDRPKLTVSSQFLLALAHVESGLDPCAVGDAGELGMFQLTKIAVDDVNRILREDRYVYQDRRDILKSKEIARIYLEYWGKYFQGRGHKIGPAELVTIYRWGPSWRPECCQTELDTRRIEKLFTFLDKNK